MTQQVKAWIIQLSRRNAQHFRAKISAQRPLIEHKADVKSRGQRRFNLIQLVFPNPCPIKLVWLIAGALPMLP